MKKLILILILFSCVCFSQDNFWEQTNGPYGGNIYSIAISSKGTIFVGTIGLGAFRSTNDGVSWNEINFDLNSGNANNVAYLVINSNDCILASTSEGMYKSSDDGENWINLKDSSLYLLATNSVGYFFAKSSGVSESLYRSTNNGDSWTKIINGLPEPIHITCMAVNSLNYLFIGTGISFFISTDNGDNWSELIGGIPQYILEQSWGVQSMVINSNDEIFAAFGYQYGPNLDDVYATILKSSDNGNTWEDTNMNIFPPIINALSINSKGYIFAGTANGVYRSTDNGNNWTPFESGLNTSYEIQCISIDSSDYIYAGTRIGIYKSTDDGENWVKAGVAAASNVSSLAITSNGKIFAGVHGDGIYRTLDNGRNWSNIRITNSVNFLKINSKNYIFTNNYLGILRSTDDGENWKAFNFASGYNGNGLNVLAINSSDYIFAAFSIEGIFRSTNDGSNWEQINTGLTSNKIIDIAFNANNEIFTLVGNQPYQLFRSIDNGNNWSKITYNPASITLNDLMINTKNYIFARTLSGVIRSTDNGNNWTEIDFLPEGTGNYTLACNSNDSIFAGTGLGVYLSTNDGDTWTPINSGLDNSHVNVFVFDSSGLVFAGTKDGGVFRSTDSSITPVELISFNASVINNAVSLEWITATETNNKGFEIERSLNDKTNWQKIGYTEGNGTTTNKKSYSFVDNSVSNGTYFYRLKQIDLDGSYHYSNVIEINLNAPLEYSISQNYPNPFNPSTEIKYSIKENSLVTLKIYDLLGSEIATIINEEKPAGNYNVTFDADNLSNNTQSLSSGIYFYTITAGNFHQTKKMVLLK